MTGVEVALRSDWVLADGVRVGRDDAGQLYLVGASRLALGPATPELVRGLKQLTAGAESAAIPSQFDHRQWFRDGWLRQRVWDGEQLLFVRHALPGPAVSNRPPMPTRVRLSPLTVLHRGPDGLRLESLEASSVLTVPAGPMLELIGRLAVDNDDGTGSAPMLAELWTDGFLTAVDAPVSSWSAHEAWFHARSRWGARAANDYVGPVDDGSIGPALKPSPPPIAVRLPRPDQDELSLSLSSVLAARASVRHHDDEHPLTLTQLASFLHFSAAVRDQFSYQGNDYTRRSYPSGGTAYELEIYVAAGRVSGLPIGLYHYDPLEHALRQLPAEPSDLLARAQLTVLGNRSPQCLLVITARFDRILPRYRGMGYATTLKNVGALFQNMYLVATALGLAPCALGNGDNALIEDALQIDRQIEGGVGEFLLGSRPTEVNGAPADSGPHSGLRQPT